MSRIILFAAAWTMISGLAASADEPQPDATKPPYERLLQGEDAKRAAELNEKVEKAEQADKYDEAIELTEQLLELRTNVQGADHWETVNDRWDLDACRKVGALSAEERAGWRKTVQGVLEAKQLEANGLYLKAEPLWREYRSWCERVLREKHPSTATSNNNLASNLYAQGKYAKAQPFLQKALDLDRELLGEKHPVTARIYLSLANDLNAQSKYADAQPLSQKALDLNRELLGETHLETANSYHSLADSLNGQGKYADAQPLLQKALELCRELLGEKQPDTALSYLHSLAISLNGQGKYADAQPLLQKALDLNCELLGERHPDTAISYLNLANNLNAQRNYADAHPISQKALDLNRELLGEKHLNTAMSYASLAENLGGQGKFAEAQPLFEKALDLNRELFGEKHPATALSYNNLAGNLGELGKNAEALPLLRKALDLRLELLGEKHPDTATSYNNLALNLLQQGKYAEAQPLLQKALDLNRELFGEKHPATALSYNNLAGNLGELGKNAEALPLLRKALDLRLELLGEKHLETAVSYVNLAANLYHQGKYAEALPLYQKALDLRRELVGEKHPATANSYDNLASNLKVQGKYAEALPLYQKALDIYRELLGEKHPATALSYNNLAMNLQDQGKFAEAQPLIEKALDLNRELLGEKHPATALSYNNLAMNLHDQDKFAEAQPFLQKALDLHRELLGEKHPATVRSYSNLANSLSNQGKRAEAQPLLEKALDLRRELLGENHPDTARSYNNLAMNLQEQGKFAEAQPLIEKALDLNRELLGEKHPSTALSYENLALLLIAQGSYADAQPLLVAAAATYEAARLSVAGRGLERAVFGDERSPYGVLAAAEAQLAATPAAWVAAETDLARGLGDESASRRGVALTPDEQNRQAAVTSRLNEIQAPILQLVTKQAPTGEEKDQLGQLQDERRTLESELAELAVALSRRELASLRELRSAIPADAALVLWVDLIDQSGQLQEHWGCVVRDSGDPMWEQLPGSGADKQWLTADTSLPRALSNAVAGGATEAEIADLVGKLHTQRIAPLEKHLNGVKQLFVVPVNLMAGVPVDVLTNKFTVSYVPSGTFLARLNARPAPSASSLLALGDPVFPSVEPPTELPLPSGGLLITQVLPGGNAAQARLQPGDVLLKYAGAELALVEQLGKLVQEHAQDESIAVVAWREGETADRNLAPGKLSVVLDLQPAPEAIAAKRQADKMLFALARGGDWTELPGSAIEVACLMDLVGVDETTGLTRSDASEQELERLRADGKLKDFRYLHFATHGEPNNSRSFESALILAQDQISKDVPLGGGKYYDGRLTANEVLETWELNADLVTLSACESALGRPGGGDGALGFAQAFLLAGSRAVCLSLWKVDDTATALLMDRFYQNLLGKREGLDGPMPKAAALADAKAWLRELSAEEALKLTGAATNGVVRGTRGKGEKLKLAAPAVDAKQPGAKEVKPFAHPRFWSAFILIGDPN